jgi:serine/threonine-protein kinase
MRGRAVEQQIGHYQIVGELGRGGMGVVYKAHEESLNRFVAIKVLGEHLSEDPSYVQRFVREAQSAAKLNHPNIVQIYAINKHESQHYFVMEYVSGTSLLRMMKTKGKLDSSQACNIMLQTASGLQVAHDQGIIHRDIKPANLMIDNHGIVKIADFGLALAIGGATRLTATGMFMGTPGYLSPEQCLNEDIDSRTDIYSLGVTFYEALTGVMPFKADSPLALIRQIVDVEPPDVIEHNPDIDEKLRSILARMMAKNRDERFSDCGKLSDSLRQYLGVSAAGNLPPLHLATTDSASRPPALGNETAPVDHESTPAQLDTSPTLQVESGAGEVAPPPPPPIPEPMAVEPEPGRIDETEQIRPEKARSSTLVILAAAAFVLLLISASAVAWRLGWIGGDLSEQQVASVESSTDPDYEGEADPTSAVDALDAGPEGDQSTTVPESVGTAGEATLDSPEPTSSGAHEDPVQHQLSSSEAHSKGGATSAPPRVASAGGERSHSTESTSLGEMETTTTHQSETMAPADPPGFNQPPPTGVVVLGVGERLLAGEIEAMLEQALGRAGALLVDEDALPGMGRFLDAASPPQPEALIGTLRPHARYLLLARAEYVGERPLQYMGRRDTAFQSRLRIFAIDLTSGKPLGPGINQRLEYTHANVKRVSEQLVREHARPFVRRLAQR